jgi:hypothetical protein
VLGTDFPPLFPEAHTHLTLFIQRYELKRLPKFSGSLVRAAWQFSCICHNVDAPGEPARILLYNVTGDFCRKTIFSL